MKYYYAIFKITPEAVEVEFPDLAGCVTFGSNWDEAIANATDALAAWLGNAEIKFLKEPSTYEELQHLKGKLVPIPVDENILKSYQELKRFNVIFPATMLNKIDTYREEKGLKRSTFLLKAAEEYLQRHNDHQHAVAC
jgi:predicted RNase H-like HicB family nuclease